MNPIVVLLAVIVFLFYLYVFITSKPTTNYPPGPTRLPIIGSYLFMLWENFQEYHLAFLEWSKRYKSPVIGFYLADYNVIVTNDYESCREVFTNPDLQGRPDVFPLRVRALGEKTGIFDDDGPEWLRLRRFTLRQFRDLGFGRRSEKYEEVLEEEAKELVEQIRSHCVAGEASAVPQVFYPSFFNCIFHLLSSNRLPLQEHHKLQELGNVGERFLLSTNATGRLLALFPRLRYLFPDQLDYTELRKTSHVFDEAAKKSFQEHRDSFDGSAPRDLIDVYLNSKEKFPNWTEKQLLVATTDLTFPNTALTAQLAWAMVYMSFYPEVQRKCQEQLDDVVGRGRLPSLNDRQNLPYVEATLREVQRRQTLVPLGFPHSATANTVLCGYHVPKDTVIITNLYGMHMDEKIWGDPESFRPERFLDSKGALKKKDFSLPFGLGKRVCAGETFARQNLFVIFAAVMQNFTVFEETKIDLSKMRHGFIDTLQPDLQMRFRMRE